MSNLLDIIEQNLDKGFSLSFDSNDLCCPDCLQDVIAIPASPMLTTHEINDGNYRIYLLASVEIALKYFEGVGLTYSPNNIDCCVHINASIENTLKMNEAFYYNGMPNNFKTCSTNFNSCINNLLNSLDQEIANRILDIGIVEYGSISGQSQICLFKYYVDLIYNSQNKIIYSKENIIDVLLSKGIVVSCYNGEMTISSVETFLKWFTSYILQLPV